LRSVSSFVSLSLSVGAPERNLDFFISDEIDPAENLGPSKS